MELSAKGLRRPAFKVRSGRRRTQTIGRRRPLAWLVTALLALPIVAVATTGIGSGGGDVWEHIVRTRLLEYVANTAFLLVLTGIVVVALAVPAAWLVTAYQFPGRSGAEWLLVLPLAMPGYLAAYAWSDLVSPGGPFAAFWPGWLELHSLSGLAVLLGLCLYPYAYLAARSAFALQSVCALQAAASLGAGPLQVFRRVVLPASAPAITAGIALALMEAAASYGAPEFLGVPVLAVGIVRSWEVFGEPATAARLALVLLVAAMALHALNRLARGRAGAQATSTRWQAMDRQPLSPAWGMGAAMFCALPIALGFVLPAARLAWLSWEQGAVGAMVGGPLLASFSLASITALIVIIAGLLLTVGGSGRAYGPGLSVARAGYAVPGAVLAAGGLALLAVLRENGIAASAAAPVAATALIWVYATRFSAPGVETIAAAAGRAPTGLWNAAEVYAPGRWSRLRHVELPLLMPGVWTAALLVFVETVKELPATLMLRPTGLETLAVRAYGYASDERLGEAALPALLIVAVASLPVLLLGRQIARSRPGG